MGDKAILFAASAVNLVGAFVLINFGHWDIPNALKIAILVVFVALNILLHKCRQEVREETIRSGEPTDFAEKPVKGAKRQASMVLFAVAFALASPFWLPLTYKPPTTVRIQVFAGLFTAVIIFTIFLLSGKWRKLPTPVLKRSVLIGLAVCIPLICADAVGLVRSYAITRIVRQMMDAKTALEGRAQSIDSANQFDLDVKAIDPGWAPRDFKKALKDFSDALDGQMFAFRMHFPSAVKDNEQKAVDARARLAVFGTKYQ